MGNPVLLNEDSWKFGGGGGGRIFLHYSVLECGNLDVIVAWKRGNGVTSRRGGPSSGFRRGMIGGGGTISHIIDAENNTASEENAREVRSIFITVDNQDLKSTAGTPLNLPPNTVSGLTAQRTAVLFSKMISIRDDEAGGVLNRGFTLRNSHLEPFDAGNGIEISASDISIQQNSVLSSKTKVVFNTKEFKMSQSTIKFGGNLVLNCSGIVNLDGTIAEEYTSSE